MENFEVRLPIVADVKISKQAKEKCLNAYKNNIDKFGDEKSMLAYIVYHFDIKGNSFIDGIGDLKEMDIEISFREPSAEVNGIEVV